MSRTDKEWKEHHKNLIAALVACSNASKAGELTLEKMIDIAAEHGLSYGQLKEEWAEPEWE